MSIVGPRPERPEIEKQYLEELPEFGLRLQVKAGLTGYAQIFGKYNTTPEIKNDLCDVETLTQRVVCSNNSKGDYKRPSEIESGIKYNYLPRVDNKYLNRIKTIISACVEIRRWCKKNPKGVIIVDVILGEMSIALLFAKIFGVCNHAIRYC